jgi:zinc transport system ATP-binding protein
MENALEVDQLGVRIGATVIFAGLTFSVPRASCLAVIGPNGAGKSVLFKALVGSLPHDGAIRWAPGTRKGYVPQKLDIERDLPITGGDFLSAKVAVSKAPKSEVAHALERVGLARTMLRTPIGAMSGGQFQRLMVAFALIGNPTVLLLDEPAAGIDEPGQERIHETLHHLQEEGVTVMLISHDLSIVDRYANNVLCLSRTHSCFGPPDATLTEETLLRLYGEPMRLHFHAAHRG